MTIKYHCEHKKLSCWVENRPWQALADYEKGIYEAPEAVRYSLQILNSTILAPKQPEASHKGMRMALSQ